jgi:periplasmic divalent cation tolerance protein
MAESEFVFVYSTFPDRAGAEAVARTLVEGGLAACVNILPPMTSFTRWEGRLERAEECAVLIKTRRALCDAAVAAARPLHPYQTPCFLVLAVDGGNEDYLAWARAQTASCV